MLTKDSLGDFDLNKRAEYYDDDGYGVADAANKHKLNKPVKITKKSKNRFDSEDE